MRGRKIKVSLLTVGRMDWNYCAPLASELKNREEIKFRLLSAESIGLNITGDSPADISSYIGHGVLRFAEEFRHHIPDILIVNGDRIETLSAVVAACPFNIIIAHIGGGERTEGVIDDGIRHAITKMSQLHFTECAEYKKRVIQMGEDTGRVFSVGSLSIDSMRNAKFVPLDELRKRFKCGIEKDFLLITFHPVTLKGRKENAGYIADLLRALATTGLYCVFTYPNIDTNNSVIIEKIGTFLKGYRRGCFIVSAGKDNYYSLMKLCRAVVGNSSSGIIETPYFKVPTVNIGCRQKGRLRAGNIIDAGYGHSEIAASIRTAIGDSFKDKISGIKNPFYGKNISRKVSDILIKSYRKYGRELLIKRFNDRQR